MSARLTTDLAKLLVRTTDLRSCRNWGHTRARRDWGGQPDPSPPPPAPGTPRSPADGRSPRPARCTWSRCAPCAGLGGPEKGNARLSWHRHPDGAPEPARDVWGTGSGESHWVALGCSPTSIPVGALSIPERRQEQHPANTTPAPTEQPGCTRSQQAEINQGQAHLSPAPCPLSPALCTPCPH